MNTPHPSHRLRGLALAAALASLATLATPAIGAGGAGRALAAADARADATAAAMPDAPAADRPADQTVVVTATRHLMAWADAPAAVSVIGREELARRGADNTLDALRGELGVSLMSRPISGRQGISLRGMDTRHTLVLVDGQRIGASDGVIGHSDFQHDWVAVADIARIEVIRGPMSVLYGAEALGGVVNIVTRPIGDRWQHSLLAEARVAAGDRGGDGHRAAWRISGPLSDRLGLALTLSDARRGALRSPADARISELEGRHKRDAALRLAWRPASGHAVALDHRQGDEARDAGMVERSGQRRAFISDTDVARRHSALAWDADWGGRADWRSQLRAYHSRLDMDNQRSNGVTALRPNRLRDSVLDGQVSAQAGAQHRLTAGGEVRDEALINAGLPDGRSDARHTALYAQDEWQAGRDLALTAGLRHDHAAGFSAQWSPRLYAVWHAAPDWTVKGGRAGGFKPPTLKQRNSAYAEDEGPYTYHGQDGLRAETNRAWELGLAWQVPTAAVQAMLFDNRVHDLIVPVLIGSVSGRAQYQFQNVDRARLRGVESAARFRLARGLEAGLNHLLLDARDGNGVRLDKRPRHSLGASLTGTWGPSGAWEAGLRLEHTRGLALATGVAGQPPQEVPAYTMAQAHLRWRAREGLNLMLAIDNLGNRRLADLSPLFTAAEAPRTLRLSVRSDW